MFFTRKPKRIVQIFVDVNFQDIIRLSDLLYSAIYEIFNDNKIS